MKSPWKSDPNPHNLLKLFVKLSQNKIVKVWGGKNKNKNSKNLEQTFDLEIETQFKIAL